MIQLAERLRSIWAPLAGALVAAALAAGALVAAALAAGALVAAPAAPAAAVTDRADHAARLSACVGAAAGGHGFSDVSGGHVFGEAIGCVAYYGITRGTGNGSTFSPDQDVTRAQMAVFVARAARVAGVGLSSGSSRFSDLGGAWPEARDAINGLAASGIIASGGAFRPGDAITRAEMATFLVGLINKAAPNVEVGSDGTILLGAAGSRAPADDWFADTDSAEASALYELGVTTGAGPAAVQDDTRPPLDYNYEPDRTVDRGQMAAFIIRALAHTPARPAGVTAAETLTARYGATGTSDGTKTATVYWAADAGAGGSNAALRTGDVGRNHIVVDDGTSPVLLVYDDNDRFDLNGRGTTLAAFEAELADAIRRDGAGRRLTWSNYLPGSDGRVTEYNLS